MCAHIQNCNNEPHALAIWSRLISNYRYFVLHRCAFRWTCTLVFFLIAYKPHWPHVMRCPFTAQHNLNGMKQAFSVTDQWSHAESRMMLINWNFNEFLEFSSVSSFIYLNISLTNLTTNIIISVDWGTLLRWSLRNIDELW